IFRTTDFLLPLIAIHQKTTIRFHIDCKTFNESIERLNVQVILFWAICKNYRILDLLRQIQLELLCLIFPVDPGNVPGFSTSSGNYKILTGNSSKQFGFIPGNWDPFKKINGLVW